MQNQSRQSIYILRIVTYKSINFSKIHSQVGHKHKEVTLINTTNYLLNVSCCIIHTDPHRFRHCLNHPIVSVGPKLLLTSEEESPGNKGPSMDGGMWVWRVWKTEKTKKEQSNENECVYRDIQRPSRLNKMDCMKGWKLLNKLKNRTFLSRVGLNI